jgi:hypothetical protein
LNRDRIQIGRCGEMITSQIGDASACALSRERDRHLLLDNLVQE